MCARSSSGSRVCALTVFLAGVLAFAPAAGQATRAAGKAGKVSKVRLTTKASARQARRRVAHIRLSGQVHESPPGFSLFRGPCGTTLREWLERLAKVRKDQRISAVALQIDRLELNWAQAQELADAVTRLNKAKPVYAFVSSPDAMEYLVASAGREITMDPTGTVAIVGLSGEIFFFRGTLDWMGVEPQLIQIGQFKGAAEPLINKAPSKNLQQVCNAVLDDLYDQLCQQIARQRRLKIDAVKRAIDEGPLASDVAHKFRMVDRLTAKIDWPDDLCRRLSKKDKCLWLKDYGHKIEGKKEPGSFFTTLARFLGTLKEPEIHDPTVAIVNVEGIIVSGVGGDGLFGIRRAGDRTLVACLGRVAEDKRIKAVILRISSPGGSAQASEMIYQAVRRCAASKPVIASISHVGASGGYYVALGASKIYADPAAIVGSIGVVSGKLAIQGLLGKLHVSTYELTRGRNAGLYLSRPWNKRELAIMRALAEKTYQTFLSRVAASRKGKIKDIQAVAQGRLFTARQAAGNGLIDAPGGLRDAVMAAQQAAGLKRSGIITLPRPRTLMDVLAGEAALAAIPIGLAEGQLFGRIANRSGGLGYLIALAELLDRENVAMAMPYHLAVAP